MLLRSGGTLSPNVAEDCSIALILPCLENTRGEHRGPFPSAPARRLSSLTYSPTPPIRPDPRAPLSTSKTPHFGEAALLPLHPCLIATLRNKGRGSQGCYSGMSARWKHKTPIMKTLSRSMPRISEFTICPLVSDSTI